MPSHEVTLEVAAFLDSIPEDALDGIAKNDVREIAERFLSCVFERVGKSPRLLSGDDVHGIVGHLLPAHFGRKDPLQHHVPDVLRAYFDSLEQRALVPELFEVRQALEATLPEFAESVRTGVHAHEHAPLPVRPIVHRGSKVGRNDPCPCGSGKKFKKCCALLG